MVYHQIGARGLANHGGGVYTRFTMAEPCALPVGKLPPRFLEALLGSCRPSRSSRVVAGPRFGEDAAVIDLGDSCLVVKTDPITFTSERIGWYAVNINANDVACLGARPRWFLATLLLPEGLTTTKLVRGIFNDILKACRSMRITLCGGHTEITAGLRRPVVVGQMLGEVKKDKLVRKQNQRPGDRVILTKGVAVEGTAILAREKEPLLARRLGLARVRRARRLLLRPGISVVQEAMLAMRCGEIHAMHDPTEGGVLSGLYEIARAGEVGLRVWKEQIRVLPETQAFTRVLPFDPLALIASGALIVVASPENARRIMHTYQRHGIPATVIGEICSHEDGIVLLDEGKARPLRPPGRDEIARLLEGQF